MTSAQFTSPQVLIEALFLRHDPVDGFAYRRAVTSLDQRVRPDDAARSLARLDDHNDRHIVHSTSWRATDEGQIILTYLIHPDPEPDEPPLAVADTRRIARSQRPGHPAPPGLTPDHVAAHAIRHLAFLLRTDPGTAAHLASRPHTRRALGDIPGLAAGQLQRHHGHAAPGLWRELMSCREGLRGSLPWWRWSPRRWYGVGARGRRPSRG